MSSSNLAAPIIVPEERASVQSVGMARALVRLTSKRDESLTDIDVEAIFGEWSLLNAASFSEYTRANFEKAATLTRALNAFTRHKWYSEALGTLELTGTKEDRHWVGQALDAVSTIVDLKPDLYSSPEGGIVAEFRFASGLVALVIERGEALISVFRKGVDSRTVLHLREIEPSELKSRFKSE
jgi:hypothetical protein